MGANLSQFEHNPNLDGVKYADFDRVGAIMVGAIWGIVFYALAMIWTTCALVDRWRGPNDKIRVERSSVLAALVLSAVWPAVVLYLMASQ